MVYEVWRSGSVVSAAVCAHVQCVVHFVCKTKQNVIREAEGMELNAGCRDQLDGIKAGKLG